MARRNSTKEQANAEATTAEAPAENTEAPATEQENKPAEVDLSAFQNAVEEVVAQRDEATGEVPVAAIEPANQQYRALEGIKPKNAAKTWLDEQVKESITKLNVQLARAYSMVKDNLSAASGKSGAERTPTDPTQAFVNKVAAHNLAYNLVTGSAPEGVDRDAALAQATDLVNSLTEQVQQYQTWVSDTSEDKGDAPEVSPVVRTAFKLSAGKASGGGRVSGGSGVRRDIAKHIQSAFAGVEDGGFLTIAEIANHKSEEYGDDSPSQGAVSARLFPTSGKSTVPGVKPVKADESPKNVRGAIKVA